MELNKFSHRQSIKEINTFFKPYFSHEPEIIYELINHEDNELECLKIDITDLAKNDINFPIDNYEQFEELSQHFYEVILTQFGKKWRIKNLLIIGKFEWLKEYNERGIFISLDQKDKIGKLYFFETGEITDTLRFGKKFKMNLPSLYSGQQNNTPNLLRSFEPVNRVKPEPVTSYDFVRDDTWNIDFKDLYESVNFDYKLYIEKPKYDNPINTKKHINKNNKLLTLNCLPP